MKSRISNGVKAIPFLLLLFMPMVAFAQTLEFWLFEILTLLERVVIPAMIALAFFVFIWNAFKFFILQGDSKEGHDRAKQLMIYGILALVLIFIFLGIVNLLVRLFGLGSPYPVCPDYDPHCNTRGFDGRSADDGFLFPQSRNTPVDYGDDPLEPFGGSGDTNTIPRDDQTSDFGYPSAPEDPPDLDQTSDFYGEYPTTDPVSEPGGRGGV